ncbi:MAG: hypothetical protein QOF02_2246 [Blastocatellia bacterium]|nr:hypothetical protein [Blastocatellia bacterium]
MKPSTHSTPLLRAMNIFVAFVLVLSFSSSAYCGDREIGGYVDRAEDRFVRNVWNFIKNFQGQQNIGSHRYQEVQYFWGEPFEFDSSHQNFVDKMDLAYVAAHGSAYYVQTNQSTSDGVDLRNCPAYGDLANGGDLEFMIIESCNTVASAPEAPAGGDWWTPMTSIFQGLHQLVGFRTLSYSDNGIPNRYANKLKANGSVWRSWFDTVNEERQYSSTVAPDGAPYPGYASAIMYTTTENDRLGDYAADPGGGAANMKTWWQY